MLIQNYSDLTLEGMTLTLDNPNYAKAYTLSNNNGSVVIDGTTINANPAGSTAFDVCRYSSYTSVNVTVKGDSKINGDIEFDAGSGDPKDGANLTVEGGTITGNLRLTSGGSTALTDHSDKASVTKSDAIELTAPADFKWVSNGDGTSTLKPCEYVAQIEGGAKYETLEAAFAAAADGNTVTLLKDVALTDRLFVNAGAEPAYAGSNNRYATTSENKSITLDLNGNNVTGSSNIALAGGSLNIVNSGTADADHGVISTTNDGLAPIEIRGTGDLAQKRTLTVGTGVTLSGAVYGLNIFGSNDAQKNIIDVNVNGTVNGTLFVLGNLSNAENEININVAGTVYVPDNGDDKANVGVALNGIATVNVNEGAQVSGETGIEVRAGNLVVNGGNITATASTYSEKKNGSGSCTKGAAVAVAQHTTKLPITATLNGGTLTGTKTLVVTDVEEIGLNDVTVKAADALANAETVIIPEGYKWLSNGTMSTLTPCDYVAQVGETKYETLADAFSAAADGNTVTLLKDVALTDRLFVNAGATPEYNGSDKRFATTTENKSITLDLNGYNVTTSSNIALAGGSLNIVNNGTADATHGVISTSNNGLAPIEIRGTGDLTAKRTLSIGENVTLKGGEYGLNIFGSNNEQKNIIEVNVNGTVEGTLFVLGNLKNTENDVIVNVNGSITSTTDAGIALNGNAKVNVAESASVTGLSGIEARAGELNVAGGAIKATAEEYSYTPNGSGTTTKGAAIAVAQHNTLLPVTITVNGGTLEGTKTIAVVDVNNNQLDKVTVTAKDELVAENTEIPAGFKWVSSEGMSTLTPCTYVAEIVGGAKYETLAEAVAAAGTEATTIKMIANEMINVVGSAITIPANKNVVLDLNGFQVVGTAEGGSTSALITNKGTLTIKDSSDTNKDGTGTGKLISGATETWIYNGDGNYAGSYASNTITNSGTLTIESGYVENLSTGSATYAVDNNSSGGNAILNMNGGLLKAHSVAVRQFANSTTLKNEVNVAGGTVTAGYSGMWIQLPGSDTTKAMKASLNVTGGTLIGGSYAFYDYSYGNSFDATQYNLDGGTFNGDIFSYGANFNITDGTYNGEVAIKQAKPSNVAVSGGKFGGDVYTYGDNASEGFITGGVFAINTYEYEGHIYECDWLSLLADGYIPTDNTDPETKDAYPYAVKQGSFICAIGETKYETLQDAINACEAGTETTIKLLCDVADGAGFAIPDGTTNKNIIIDFDGKSYNVSKDAVGSGNTKTQAMHFYSGNTLTLKNGMITSVATSDENKLKMMMQNYCDLTLDGMTIDCSNINGGTYGTFTGADAYWSNKSVPVFNFNTGNATIKNTTITFRDGDNMGLCVDGGTVALGEGTVINGPVSAVTGTVTITDGKYSGEITADQATLTISGGIFTLEPDETYCAEGYVATDNKDEATKEQYPFTVMSKEDAGIFELFDSTTGDRYKPYSSYGITEDKNVQSVSYTRVFTTNDYNKYRPWYLPFDYTLTDDDLNNFDFYRISMIAGAAEAGEITTDEHEIILFIKKVESGGTLLANRPYILKAKENGVGEFVFKTEKTTLYAPDATSRKHLETSEFKYDFYGNYEDLNTGAVGSLYYLGSGGAFTPNKPNVTLKSYRWYVKETDNEGNADAKFMFTLVEESEGFEGIATSLDTSSQSASDEIDGIYNASGMKIDTMTKGLNIIRYKNGKVQKIYIK